MNTRTENLNSKFFAKKNNLVFQNDTPYLLDTGNQCLSIQNNNSPIITSSNCNDFDLVTPVYIDNVNDKIIVDKQNDICLRFDGTITPQLLKCNDYDNSQKFVYDNVYKSIRPLNDTSKCMWRDRDGVRYFIDCDNEIDGGNKITTLQNYYRPEENDFIEYFEKDYTIDMRYYIIYIILLMIIFFMIVVIFSGKKI